LVSENIIKNINMADIVPGTAFFADKNEGIFVKTADSFLAVTRVKPQSKNEMDFKSFLNGSKDFIGSVLKNDIEK